MREVWVSGYGSLDPLVHSLRWVESERCLAHGRSHCPETECQPGILRMPNDQALYHRNGAR